MEFGKVRNKNDFGKRLTQATKRKGTFFFLSFSIVRQKHTSEPRKKKRGLVGKKFGSCYEYGTLM